MMAEDERRDRRIGELTIAGFLAGLGSNDPTPGGGAAAALAGGTGAALIAMVARLTVGKAGFEAVQTQMAAAIERADSAAGRFLELADEDAAAFEKVMTGFRMPKTSDEEKAARSAAIQEASRGAADVPLSVAALAAGLIELARDVTAAGNVNAASDGLSAAASLYAAVLSASANVSINAAALRDTAARDAYLEDIAEIRGRADLGLEAAEAAFAARLSS